jgi:hypothetical protein
MVLEDREEKRDTDVDDEEDKENVVKIEAKHGDDQEEGQLVSEPDSRDEDRRERKENENETDSKLPTTTTLEAGEVPTPQVEAEEEEEKEEEERDDEKESEVGEKRKEMPASPLKARSSPAVKKRRVANSPQFPVMTSSSVAKSTTPEE